MPTLAPLAKSPSATLQAVVDLPTPPLPEATARMVFTLAGFSGVVCGLGWPPILRLGGSAGLAAGLCAVSATETCPTPSSAATARSAAARSGSICRATSEFEASITKRTLSPSMLSARIISRDIRLPPSGSCSSASRASISLFETVIFRLRHTFRHRSWFFYKGQGAARS